MLPDLGMVLLCAVGVCGWSSGMTGADLRSGDRLVIAHRGASGYLPEHTLVAKALAYGMGADYLEQDVVLSRDNVPVVLHDVHIDAVTDVARRYPGRAREDGRYYALDFDLAELKELRVSERVDPATGKVAFSGRFPLDGGGFQIPTLEEEIRFIQGLNRSMGRGVGIYPEIKAPSWHRGQGRDPSRVVLEVLGRYGYRTKDDPVIVQCFEFTEVKRIRGELGYRGRLVQLIGGGVGADGSDYGWLTTPEGLAAIAEVADGIGPNLQHIVTEGEGGEVRVGRLVGEAHAAGLVVHPYTVRADALPGYADSLEELLGVVFDRAGVDGVFTDFPDRVVRFLGEGRRGVQVKP
ncbi:MAG: glycerophosphodiester phosphodiesterase [Verrucomicrobiota bacterium]